MASETRKPRGNADQDSSDAGRAAWSLLFELLENHRKSLRGIWSDLELTGPQAQLLHHLKSDSPQAMNGLAGELVCHASNVTGLVDNLEKRGLIERRADENDRRVKMIALTKDGARVRAKLVARLAEPPDFIEAMAYEDQTRLLSILERAVKSKNNGA